MSVLVKGWSIPTDGCCGCYFRTGKYCGILDKNERVLEYAERFTRPDNCPLMDEEPVRHGKWIETDERDVFSRRLYRCSNCKTFVIGNVDNYCSYCGARMDEE